MVKIADSADSFKDVRSSELTGIVNLKNIAGEKFAVTLVYSIIAKYMAYLSVPINKAGIQFASMSLVKKYPHFKPEDFALMCKRGVQAEYGELYNRMDVSVLMAWAKAYSEERMTTSAMASQAKALEEGQKNFMPKEELGEKIRELIKRIDEKAKANKPNNFRHNSLESYCEANEIDINPVYDLLKKTVEDTYDKNMGFSKQVYFDVCKSSLLTKLNDGKINKDQLTKSKDHAE